jgi:hypothetical protein
MQENMECGGSSLCEAHLYRAHVSNVLQEEHTDITMHTWYSAALASLCLTQILALSTQILKMKNDGFKMALDFSAKKEIKIYENAEDILSLNTNHLLLYQDEKSIEDLIVLSILGRECCNLKNKVWLFREEINTGKIQYDAEGEEVFEWFSINQLTEWLSKDFSKESGKQRQFILNYCFAMSVLGNDFLPTSMTFRLKEGGHHRLLELVEKARKAATGGRLWTAGSGLDLKGWQTGLQYLSYGEEGRFKRAVEKKLMAKGDDTDPEDEPLRVKAFAFRPLRVGRTQSNMSTPAATAMTMSRS